MNELEEEFFSSASDLYRRLYPALITKREEINLKYKSNIKELDIWNYLKDFVWSKKKDLSLCDMVNDCLNIDEKNIFSYVNGE